ncbi:hypothetical protein SEVIR_9G435500v4 [Setaria viridis]|nr:uncharacterized protein LOC117836898 isoform X2 [Setaria viridis]TKV96546.1 hypothetical protein SEVIR_9G435500v2 [Setaria viridis]TKV96547.1 hypothetical protein SEVIR_9G435500v2 [Setaria viridis]TKV96548.1 hypothetical protein SEVIR_9G435500v2 [Setaria viridis]
MYAARTSVLRPVAPPPPSASRAASFLHCAEHPPGGTPPAGSPPSSATPGHLRAPHAGASPLRPHAGAPPAQLPTRSIPAAALGKREEVPHRVAAATHKRNKAAAAKEHGRALAFAHLHVMLLQSVVNVYSGSRRPTSSAWPRPSLRDPDIVLDLCVAARLVPTDPSPFLSPPIITPYPEATAAQGSRGTGGGPRDHGESAAVSFPNPLGLFPLAADVTVVVIRVGSFPSAPSMEKTGKIDVPLRCPILPLNFA